jgi:DUF1365 family protein
LYEGVVTHVRYGAVPHRFSQRVQMCYLDLDEIPSALSGGHILSAKRWRPVQLRSCDHGARSWDELAAEARRIAGRVAGGQDIGAVRLLVHPRVWGWSFTPLALGFCFDPGGSRVLAVLATVTNTPWGERHTYPLVANPDGSVTACVAKALHVSPFFSMAQSYRFSVTLPGPTLRSKVEVVEAGALVLRASLFLQRRPLSWQNVARLLLLRPASSWSVSAGIYWQASKLALKRAPFHVHPAKLGEKHQPVQPCESPIPVASAGGPGQPPTLGQGP